MNVIAQVQGGLGNQLFQYATARSLALQHQSPLILDHSWFSKSYTDVTPRDPLLKDLNTTGTLLSLELTPNKPRRIQHLLQKIWPVNPYIYSEKTPYRFDSELFNSTTFRAQNLYLVGYWQSYRYFESIKNILQSEFSPRVPLAPHYQYYLSQIRRNQSAMIHVRRGDYVHLTSVAKVHGFLGLKYYQKGMEMILEGNPNIQFFVFSDDLSWAKNNLPYQDRLTFIDSLESRDAVIQELELMTQCQYHLIANSSLSWWAAWLAKSGDNFVICPSNWTSNCVMNWDDLLPAHWQRI